MSFLSSSLSGGVQLDNNWCGCPSSSKILLSLFVDIGWQHSKITSYIRSRARFLHSSSSSPMCLLRSLDDVCNLSLLHQTSIRHRRRRYSCRQTACGDLDSLSDSAVKSRLNQKYCAKSRKQRLPQSLFEVP